MALSPQAFEGLSESDKNLRRMHVRQRRAAIFVVALAIWSALVSEQGRADPFDSASGIYVSSGAGPTGVTLTIQQGARLMVYSASNAIVVRERSADGPWTTTSLAQLTAGEPVTAHLDPAGYVTSVDAQYTTITTRLIAQHDGALITTSGHAYRLVGAAAQIQPNWPLGTFLRLHVDPATDEAFAVTASSQPFAGGPLAQPIAVTFVVTVPLNTPTRDVVYMASDSASWVPNGVRLAPMSGNRWTVTLTLGKGSSIKYKFTRGSWETAETNQSGMEIPNRSLTITTAQDAQTVEDTVLRWSDLPS